MAVVHDATSGDTGTTDLSFLHTPAGTPAGVLVLIAQAKPGLGGPDEVIGVTYGGVAMVEAPESPLNKAAGSEDAFLHAFFLGSGIPPGPQTVAVDVDATASSKRAQCITVTADGTTAIEDTGTLDSGGTAAPSVTLSTSVETAIYGLLYSGVGTPSAVTPGADYTEIFEHDFGAQVASFVRRTSNAPPGGPAVDWTQTSDTAGVFAVAIREVALIGEDSLNPGGGEGLSTAQRVSIATYTV